jgi:hypothetical protein
VRWAAVRIDRVVTSGMWRFDGQQVPVDDNVWFLGDDHEVLVVDASHDLGPVREAIAGTDHGLHPPTEPTHPSQPRHASSGWSATPLVVGFKSEGDCVSH